MAFKQIFVEKNMPLGTFLVEEAYKRLSIKVYEKGCLSETACLREGLTIVNGDGAVVLIADYLGAVLKVSAGDACSKEVRISIGMLLPITD